MNIPRPGSTAVAGQALIILDLSGLIVFHYRLTKMRMIFYCFKNKA